MWIANHVVVPCSFSARGCADFKNASTSFSFPGFASSIAKSPNLFMVRLQALGCSRPSSRCCPGTIAASIVSIPGFGYLVPGRCLEVSDHEQNAEQQVRSGEEQV